MTRNDARIPRHPPAPAADLAACESALGVRLPEWLRNRLLLENGWEVDDHAGVTIEEWRFLPVLDRTDRKRRARTAEDIVWHTRKLRAEAAVPAGAVVVARAWNPMTRLILLPDSAEAAALGSMLWRQYGAWEPEGTPVDPATLGQVPEPKAGSGLRARSELPVFRYHPDPVATGSIHKNHTTVCPCCGLQTGWRYSSSPYGLGAQPKNLCPWCIADGAAAAKFGSEFTCDILGDVSAEVADEVSRRTPGFISWQDERWLTHCGDAAAFLGPAGWDRLKDLPDARAALIQDGWREDMLPMLSETGDVTGYLFQCLHCGVHLAYADAS